MRWGPVSRLHLLPGKDNRRAYIPRRTLDRGGRRPDDSEFWPAEDPSKVRSFFHRIPRLAILQVGAVIVILIVVLLRIG